MKEVKKAIFNFQKYRVREFSFIDISQEDNDTIDINFLPSGTFDEVSKIFTVTLIFTASPEATNDTEAQSFCKVVMESTFLFRDQIKFEEIPDYFFRNSLGIIFPYVRAFVSTLTFQANIQPPMILPILNLTQLEEQFKNETKVIRA